MSKLLLSRSTVADIDKRIARVLNEIGNPPPPVPHELIRDVLRLDMEYFQKDDPGIFSEVWSRLKRSTKQIIQRPNLLREIIEQRSLKAAYLPDAKRIYVSADLSPLKKRWGETHECVHGLLPWHKNYMLGDDSHTLTQACIDKLEAEANYGTGRFLFAGGRFVEELADLPQNINTAVSLSKAYKNSIESTLWRIVESSEEEPHFAYICPVEPARPDLSEVKFIKSEKFDKQFSNITCIQIQSIVASYININRRFYVGDAEKMLADVNGDTHCFHFETINNSYSFLTLATTVPF